MNNKSFEDVRLRTYKVTFRQFLFLFKANLDGMILSHATCLQQAYDTNCVV